MKWVAVLLLLSGPVPPAEANLVATEFGQFTLRMDFPASFSGLRKSCGRLFPGLYVLLLDSSGFTHDLLRGRVTRTATATSIEFKISNVRLQDGGYYRCIVDVFYKDYAVQVVESPNHRDPPPTPTLPAAPVGFTEPAQAQDDPSARAGWSWTLVAAASAAAALAALSLGSVACVVVRRRRSKRAGEHASAEDATKDVPAVVYTTVDFTPKQSERYAELRTGDKRRGSSGGEGHAVEYSTLAVHHGPMKNC